MTVTPHRPSARHGLDGRASIAALALVLSAATTARPQADTSMRAKTYFDFDTSRLAQCRDTLSPANVVRLTVGQQVELKDTTSAILAQLDLVGERIADAARASLGASGQAIPTGDSLGMLPSAYNAIPIDIVMHREGPWAWRPGAPDKFPAPPKLTAFYARVLGTIPADSLWIVWPDGYQPDSVVFRLVLFGYSQHVPTANRRTSLFSVFTTKGILERPAVATHIAWIEYPPDANFHHIVGEVLLQFVIDTTGRADAKTIRVLEPTAARMDSSEFATFYTEFIRASRSAVEQSRYSPARLGGCLVREQVQQPFAYSIRRPSNQ